MEKNETNEIKSIEKFRPSPIFLGLPDYLKDPKNYERVEKTILESLAGKHSHGEVIEWASCASCQRRFRERGFVIKRLGFRSPAQYMAWKKTMHVMMGMIGRDPLLKHKSVV